MGAINSIEQLEAYRQEIAAGVKADLPTVLVCFGTGCQANGARPVAEAFSDIIEEQGLELNVNIGIKTTGCHGYCENGPLVALQPQGILYLKVRPEDVAEIVEESIKGGRIVERLIYRDKTTSEMIAEYSEIPFYKHQHRIALRHIGNIDPASIDDYILAGGYAALAKALRMKPDDIITEIEDSGLRGRGGGGFPAGTKWRSCVAVQSDARYVLCNGDEGDPGAFMDRSIMEGDPHSVIEGMIIGAIAVDAHRGYIYVRDEYPLAVRNLNSALEAAREKGLLGENILGSGFAFDIRISRGGGAFVCGESSALMRSVGGEVGEPRAKYIRSVERGLYDKPTVLNNVETWTNVPEIIVKGAEWYAGMGTEGSKGTKVFSLVGKVNNTGLVEVPMGISIRELVEDIGGGILNGKRFKAVQTGGPSGGCIPERMADLPIDFDSLTEAGSMMGSGGIIVMDEETCMVDVAKYFINFLVEESCGKCTPCRDGLPRMLDLLTDITEGRGGEEHVAMLEELCDLLTWGALCGLGTSAANPVLSTIKYFRDEYDAHIRDKKCPAGVCKALITYSIDAEACTGCRLCAKNCPQECITGKRKEAHVIDTEKCIKCGVCRDVCTFDAVRIS
ncbi:MAG: NADH-ubiquinone oxidoreductase-F iron-sulfur binding region domain-containing protein [Actinomycetota bacterium]|nr:NADH-ubiquinone oxidoreductase-F iron-sulfur binding region domain-containing protein [Actinomycetota bacterium]MDD5667527.1 NADH-ubiquinone oxidoreductase-F iron-sulfur binding region domain-containing protein [Actinomycetota bacterium]